MVVTPLFFSCLAFVKKRLGPAGLPGHTGPNPHSNPNPNPNPDPNPNPNPSLEGLLGCQAIQTPTLILTLTLTLTLILTLTLTIASRGCWAARPYRPQPSF